MSIPISSRCLSDSIKSFVGVNMFDCVLIDLRSLRGYLISGMSSLLLRSSKEGKPAGPDGPWVRPKSSAMAKNRTRKQPQLSR